MAKHRTIGLLSFLRGSSDQNNGTPGCSNYNHEHGGCLLCWSKCDKSVCVACELQDTRCRVELGQRCNYFEKAVLPTAWQIGCGDSILKQYRQKSGEDLIGKVKEIKHEDTKYCECGEPLRLGWTVRCPKCQRKYRRQYKKEHQQKLREKERLLTISA